MSRTVYINGEYLPEERACLSPFDRGFLFADAVYEVTPVIGGRLIEFDGHMQRLARSLGELDMPAPLADAELLAIHRELLQRNALQEGLVYLQISRGVADRDFVWPQEMTPTLVLFTQAKPLIDSPLAARGARVVTAPDRRWGRRDIKTVQLLYPSMVKTAAKTDGADDVWMVEDGRITEGSSSNAHIVLGDGTLVTRALSESILHGITRRSVLQYAREAHMAIEERAFTVAEAKNAAEAFMTAATALVTPVVAIDGDPVGDGRPGPVTQRLRELYIAESERRAI